MMIEHDYPIYTLIGDTDKGPRFVEYVDCLDYTIRMGMRPGALALFVDTDSCELDVINKLHPGLNARWVQLEFKVTPITENPALRLLEKVSED